MLAITYLLCLQLYLCNHECCLHSLDKFEPEIRAPARPGMTFCLPLAYYLESVQKKRRAMTQEGVPLLSTEVGMTCANTSCLHAIAPAHMLKLPVLGYLCEHFFFST